MAKIISSSILAILIFMSCSNSETVAKVDPYPECISAQIQFILSSPVQIPKANIKKYNYKGNVVYAINYIVNDGRNLVVYNDKCELICSSGSTIDGTPFNSCIEWDKATFEESVWTDPR
jgi:hypothetical protein